MLNNYISWRLQLKGLIIVCIDENGVFEDQLWELRQEGLT